MALFSFLSTKKSSGVFVLTLKGFEEYKGDIGNGSFDAVARSIGFHTDQVSAYYDFDRTNRRIFKSSIHCVAFEVFSNNVAFVMTKGNVRRLRRRSVNRFLKRFVLTELFDSYNVERILEQGIENKSLSYDFLTKVLFIRNSSENGMFHADLIGHYLEFSGGYLSAYVPSDGLNKWAKGWKESNPNFLRKYVEDSYNRWGNNQKVVSEINAQAEAFASIPGGWLNKYIQLHRTSADTINFVMLQVCHYEEDINLGRFKDINHGRYTELILKPIQKVFYFKVGKYIYTFDRNEKLKGVMSEEKFSQKLV